MPNETRGRLVTDIYLLYKFLKILWKSPLVVIKLLEVRLQYCFVEKTFAKPIGFLWGRGFFLLKKKKKRYSKGIQCREPQVSTLHSFIVLHDVK